MLKTNVERLEGSNIKLSVTVSADEVDAAIAETYSRLGSKLRIPGFRKGKAPRPVVDNYVGKEYVLAEATEDLVNATYMRAIDQESLRTIEAPEMEGIEHVYPGEEYTYVAEVELRPELTLSGYEGIKVEVPSAEVIDADIDVQIDEFRERAAGLAPAEGRGVQEGDYALISFVGYVDNETYDGNVVDKYLYELGKGLMPEQFEQGILGMEPGDERRIEFEIPDTTSNPDYVGKNAQFDVTVHEIKEKVLPPVDDDLAAQMGFDNVEEMKNDLRQRIGVQKALYHDRVKEKSSREELVRRSVGDIPHAMIVSRAGTVQTDFMRRLEDQQMTLESYTLAAGLSAEDLQKEFEEQAEQQIREDLALEALFRMLGYEVTDEDIDKELEDISKAGDISKEDARKKWEDMGLLPVVRESVMHRRAVGWLMDNVEAVIVEPGDASENEKPAEGTKKPAKKRAPKKAAAAKKSPEPETAEQPEAAVEASDAPATTEE